MARFKICQAHPKPTKASLAVGKMQCADFADALSLTLGAGLSLENAFVTVARLLPEGSVFLGCTQVIQKSHCGVSFYEALAAVERDAPEYLQDLFASLRLALKMGSDLVPLLELTAQSLRNSALSEIEEVAAEIPTKMLFPLALCILPVIFTLLCGEFTVGFLQSLFQI